MYIKVLNEQRTYFENKKLTFLNNYNITWVQIISCAVDLFRKTLRVICDLFVYYCQILFRLN